MHWRMLPPVLLSVLLRLALIMNRLGCPLMSRVAPHTEVTKPEINLYSTPKTYHDGQYKVTAGVTRRGDSCIDCMSICLQRLIGRCSHRP